MRESDGMGTLSTPLEIDAACPGLPIPGPLRPTGPGGGGAFFPHRANLDEEESLPDLVPSTPPLCDLTLGDCPYRIVRTFATLSDFPLLPCSSDVVAQDGHALWCGLFASAHPPLPRTTDPPVSIVTVGNGQDFEAFRLVWASPTVLGRNARCGPELGWEFELYPAGVLFNESSTGVVTRTGAGTLVVSTEQSRLAPVLLNSLVPRPWAWRASFRAGRLAEGVPVAEDAALVALLCEAGDGQCI